MPREVHETYSLNPDDPSGEPVLTGYIVITRESPWDDKARDRAIALTEYEATICGCGCGLPMEVGHKSQTFAVHEVVCYAGRAIEQLKRHHREQHKNDDQFFDGRQYVAVPASEKEADDN